MGFMTTVTNVRLEVVGLKLSLFMLLIVFSASALAVPRETKIKLTCANVSEAEARRLLAHYCRDFKIVADLHESDYSLILLKTQDGDLPYTFTVQDSIDADVVAVDKRSQLSGAVKDACSAMHIRFGEGQAGQQ
jgi:hypothetical protein